MLDKLVDLYIEMFQAILHVPVRVIPEGEVDEIRSGMGKITRVDDRQDVKVIPPNIEHERDYLEKLIDHYLSKDSQEAI